jgi:hypothetical protein
MTDSPTRTPFLAQRFGWESTSPSVPGIRKRANEDTMKV